MEVEYIPSQDLSTDHFLSGQIHNMWHLYLKRVALLPNSETKGCGIFNNSASELTIVCDISIMYINVVD